MKKLNKTQQVKVEAARLAIQELQKKEVTIYEQLTEELNDDNDWLYDYVFNCSSEDDYAMHVKGQIFE